MLPAEDRHGCEGPGEQHGTAGGGGGSAGGGGGSVISATIGGQDYTHNLDSGKAAWGGYQIPDDHPDHLRSLVEQAAALKTSPSANQAERLAGACYYFQNSGSPVCAPHFLKTLECGAASYRKFCGDEIADPYSGKIALAIFAAPFLIVAAPEVLAVGGRLLPRFGAGAGAGAGAAAAGETGAIAARGSSGAESAMSGTRLGRQLASEQQVGEQNALRLAGPGAKKPLRVAPRLARDYGGAPEDWAKMGSSSYAGPDGFKLETNWYENIKTGQRVEFKSKFQLPKR